ncbi:MAG: ribulose-phosphate 3-epimerase [Nanoarchaeota archaeon]|nr:ribulose-phosphate 3-epimerase [Nanoarchaeota archaeon]MBU1855057.1 ribulose-phosphate 3-epimerase [Nanoarchaeota archaeon]
MAKVSASVLSENFSQEAVDEVSSADFLQLDVMDGLFVPNKTIWADTVNLIKTSLPKDVHLMIIDPEEFVQEFIDAGADRIAFHIEATEYPESVIGQIQGAGLKAGIALSIETPVKKIFPFLENIDYVIVMPIIPGASGQKFDKRVLEKIKAIRAKNPDIEIEVDGGIDGKTGKLVVEAGADILVADSFIHSGDAKERIKILKNI